MRAAGCSAALLVCGLIAAVPAGAAGWTEATTVGGGAASVPALSADESGDVGIAYQLGEAGITGAVRPAAGAFTAGSLSANGESPAIATNAAGAMIAGWIAGNGVAFGSGNAATGFDSGGAVPNPGPDPAEVSVGVDDAGNRWLAWVDDPGGAVRAFRVGTGAPIGISPEPPVETPTMAVSPGGTVSIVWVRRTESVIGGGDMRMVTRIERATVGSTDIDVLETAIQITDGGTDISTGSEVREPQIVAGTSGPTIVWVREDIVDPGTPSDEDDDTFTDNVRVSLDGAGPATLGTTTGGVGTLDVDEARDGAAVVAWDESTGTTSSVRAAVRPAGGGFGPAEPVTSGGTVDPVSEARAAMRAGGEPLVLWQRAVLAVDRLDASVRGSGGWTTATPPGDLDVQDPTLSADGEGNVVAAWTATVGGDRQARVAAYDGVGPRFTSLTIPQTGRPGETLGFSAAATDTWSGVSGLNWSFGDGASANGADVQHAYASAGDYAVALTATDGEGNQSDEGSLLRISDDGSLPPPPPPPPAAPKDTTAPVVSGLAVSPRCIAAGDVRSLSATFSVSEGAQMLYSIRRRRDSLVRRRCPGVSTRKTPGISDEAGSRQEQVVAGPNSATISGAKLRRGAVHKRASRGRNRVRFSQLLTGLRPGTYQLIVRATDAAGNRSVDQIVKFWVLAPPRGD